MSKEDILEEAKSRYTISKDHWAENYTNGKDDLYFQSGELHAQWNPNDVKAREKKGRAILTIDHLSQFVNQVSNDVRMNTPSINVIPHSSGADEETAEFLQGKIRDIEQNSNADAAYDYALNMAVRGSIGFISVDHRYKDMSFDQELYIKREVNPFSIMLDPSSVESDGSDARYAFKMISIPKEEYKERYGDDAPISHFDGDSSNVDGDDDSVELCEYYRIDDVDVVIGMLPDGTSEEVKEGVDYLQTRETNKRVVRRYLLSGDAVLDETVFPGKYIPIVPVYGEEFWIENKRYLLSLIRKAKDSARRYNYLASVEAELLKKSSKAVIQAVGGTVENYAEDYINPDDAVVLRYDQVDKNGAPAPPPTIMPPYPVPVGVVSAMQRAADDIKATMGLYNAFIGQRSNETSGVAINQRKMEGDRSVFHYGDNLVRSITQVGRIIVCAAKDVLDTPRLERIITKENESKIVGINGKITEEQKAHYDLSKGEYSVRVTTGASYATMREESAEFFKSVIQSQPELMNVAGDLMFENMDFPGAQAFAARMKRTMNPALLDDTQDPQVMALQQENSQLQQALQELTAQIQAMDSELTNKQAETSMKAQEIAVKVQGETSKQQIEMSKLALEERKALMEYEIKQAELQLKARELDIEEQDALRASLVSAVPQSSGAQGGVVNNG